MVFVWNYQPVIKKDLSSEDKKVWDEFIKNPNDVHDKDENSLFNNNKNRFKFDLHGFTLDEANKKVKEIIFHCVEKNYKKYFSLQVKAFILLMKKMFLSQKI